jgi:hypothetical protein
LQPGKPVVNALGKADLCGLFGGNDSLKNLPHLLFHGPAMACCTQAQTVFDRFIKVSNGKAAHGLTLSDCNEIIVITIIVAVNIKGFRPL